MSDQIAERTRTITWDDPMIGAQLAKTMSGLEYLQAMIDGKIPLPPITQTLGFRLAEVGEGRAVFTCEPSEFHYNPIGTVHGGLAATLLDSAMGVAVHSLLPQGAGYTTVELKVNLIRPMSSTTGLVRAEAEIVNAGRSIAIAQGRIVDSAGKLYAHSTTTCMIFRPE